MGLGDEKRKFPAELSLGERQRVAVARTLALRPRIVLADEPTASLDEGNASVVMELLSHAACEGALVVVATHHLDFRAAQVVSLPRIPVPPKKSVAEHARTQADFLKDGPRTEVGAGAGR